MRILVLLLSGILVTGCTLIPGGSGADQEDGPKKNVDERGLRTDLDPLTKRFPSLGTPVSAEWESGTLGDDRAPGPTSYWIDGIVALDPAVAVQLRNETKPVTGGDVPDLAPDIEDRVPDGGLTRSDALDSELGHAGWAVDGWLIEGEDVLVLSAKGE